MEVFPSDFEIFFKGKANFQIPLDEVVKIFSDILKLIKTILNALGIIKDEDMDPTDIF